MKIKKKYYRYVLGLCVCLPVSSFSSLVVRLWNHGLRGNLLQDWFLGFIKGFAISYPLVIFFVWIGQIMLKKIHWHE